MELSGYHVEILGGEHFSSNQQSRCINCEEDTWTQYFPWSPLWDNRSRFGSRRRGDDYGTDKSYVNLRDKQHYQISLTNSHETRCNARVIIDGKHVGTWRINPFQTIKIDRPAKIDKKFTFYLIRNGRERRTGLRRGDPNNGLIKVIFTPEFTDSSPYSARNFQYDITTPLRNDRPTRRMSSHFDLESDFDLSSNKSMAKSWAFQRSSVPQCMKASCLGEGESVVHREGLMQGGTALRGKSQMKFGRADEIDLDHGRSVTINLRLVGNQRNDWYDDVSPLEDIRSNPVPPPVTSLYY